MNNNVVIEVRNVKKSFKVFTDRSNQLKDAVIYHNFNKYVRHEVLKGISFEVKKGEAVALIGKNGCGKSTTLKMLTKILTPNDGSVELKGRVASLIELGAGFHPDLSGRENIYINASIFGVKKREVDARINDIIRFSELEEFIDSPVRTYSSGMYARLAFSVAISVDADILLVDEILAVGDAAFQAKCFNRMNELKEHGVTIVIVSHSMSQVQQICDRAIWIDKGVIREEGNPKEICRRYIDETDQRRLDRVITERNETKNNKDKIECFNISEQCGPDAEHMGGYGKIRIKSVSLLNEKNEKCQNFDISGTLKVEIHYTTTESNLRGNFSIGITRDDWTFCYESFAVRRKKNYPVLKREGTVLMEIKTLNLLEGRYLLSLKAVDEKADTSDFWARIIPFNVLPQKNEIAEVGIVTMPHEWYWF